MQNIEKEKGTDTRQPPQSPRGGLGHRFLDPRPDEHLRQPLHAIGLTHQPNPVIRRGSEHESGSARKTGRMGKRIVRANFFFHDFAASANNSQVRGKRSAMSVPTAFAYCRISHWASFAIRSVRNASQLRRFALARIRE